MSRRHKWLSDEGRHMKGQFSSYLCLVLRNTVKVWGAHVARHVEYVYKSGRDGSECDAERKTRQKKKAVTSQTTHSAQLSFCN